MPNHHFTLIVDGRDMQEEEVINALFESGCDDGTVGCADAVQFVVFDRQADSLDQAVMSAVKDIERIQGLEVVRVADAGLVSIADIASRTGRTRESVRLLISGARGPGSFPVPVTDPRSRYRLWHWLEVERWLTAYLHQETDFRNEQLLTAINASLEFRHHASKLDAHLRNSMQALAGLRQA